MGPKPAIEADSRQPQLISYTVRQTAQALQLHPESVRDFLRQNRIHGFRVGRRWRVSAETLASLLKTGVPLN